MSAGRAIANHICAGRRANVVSYNDYPAIAATLSRIGTPGSPRANSGTAVTSTMEEGPVPIGPHQKLARVEGTQCRAMAHAEYRRSREPLAHQSIKTRLRSLVNRRGCLVEEEPIGLLHQRASKGDALLFAGGKLERPMASLVEPLGEVREPDGRQRLASVSRHQTHRLASDNSPLPGAYRSAGRASAEERESARRAVGGYCPGQKAKFPR